MEYRKKIHEKEKRTYEKTLLYLYPHLSKIAKQIEEQIHIQAQLSYRNSGGIEMLIERMLEQGEKMRLLLRTERDIALILKKFKKEELILLECGFFRRKRYLYDYEGQVVFISLRTFYRRIEKVVSRFSQALQERKMDKQWFEENLMEIDWIRETYNRVKDEKIHYSPKIMMRFISFCPSLESAKNEHTYL